MRIETLKLRRLTMIFRNWFDNEPKETMFCAVVSLIALILSLGGWGRELIPVDTAWIAIVLCGIPIGAS